MSNFYCPLPFKHIFVESRGVKPCCSYKFLYPGAISDWLKSDELKKIQHDMLNNDIPDGCDFCIQNEQKDGFSTRLSAVRDYENKTFNETGIDFVDYRSSNICNFRCRSCEPFFSNGIAAELRIHKELEKFQPHTTFSTGTPAGIFSLQQPNKKLESVTQDDFEWIISNMHLIKKLMFTGGEPTRIPQVKKIIDYIINNQIEGTQILITSNASFVDQYWVDITRQLKNIHWTLSLDAIGGNAEIIRDGTDWALVSKNIETMFDISPSVNIGTVITNLNVFSLDELFRWVNALADKYQNRANGRTQFIALCNYPRRMSPYNWPDSLRKKAIEYLKQINVVELRDQQVQIVQTLLDNIVQNKFDEQLWQESEAYNQTLDQIRNQSYMSLFNPRY